MSYNQKKKVLITGATGFIGKYIVEQALKNHYEVFLALRSTSNTSRLKGLNAKKIVMDFSSQSTIEACLPTNMVFDTVVHNAGVKACANKSDYYTYNTALTKNLCKALQKKKALNGKFIYISSLAALGPGDRRTLNGITETKEESPISHYGKSKLWAEKEVLKSGLDYLILRPTAVYGKGTSDYKDLIKLAKKGWAVYTASPDQRLSFIHAEDVAKVMFLSDKFSGKNQTYNVSDGIDYTLESFYQIMASAVGVQIKFRIRIPFFVISSVARLNYCIEKFFKVENALNSVEKAKEITALNWKCQAKKIKDELGFTASHSLMEIID